MRIGVPREIKTEEYRVGLTPDSVFELTQHGHRVLVETGAAMASGRRMTITAPPERRSRRVAAVVFAESDLLVKVKEPQPEERARLRPGQILFAYLHLAPDPAQARDLMASGAVYIAYETVTDADGGLPLLRPMSQVAGRLAVQAGAAALERPRGGRGVLLGGVPGVAPGRVLILGGGVVGFQAAQMAVGLQADVTILDRQSGGARSTHRILRRPGARAARRPRHTRARGAGRRSADRRGAHPRRQRPASGQP
ncbi:MAG: hypothetical protein MZV65_21825 [Chromatiales bacterium]|nr:hypothetical protein [Chromatiales bacterium]